MKLYTVVEAVPSRLLGLANILFATQGKGYTRSDIIALLQPAVLRRGADADPDMSTKVIGAARECGLVEEYDDERGESLLRLVADAFPPNHEPPRTHWEKWISRRVLHDLVDAEGRHLALAFSWLMTLRLSTAPADRVGWKSQFERDGFSLQEFGLNPDNRWDNLFDWSRFLGLTWQTRIGRDAPGVVCDPTVLLTRFLNELLPEGPEWTASDFRARLGVMFPILDGGHVFREVCQRVIAARGEPPEHADRLSPGLGMALRGLRDRGLLSYRCPDDQRTFLLFDDGERIAFISRSTGPIA
jgi:hypothetical protein